MDEEVGLDLSNPTDCKIYLDNFTLQTEEGERKVTEFQTAGGRTLKVSDMNDSQLVQYANQLYNDLDLPSQRVKMN